MESCLEMCAGNSYKPDLYAVSKASMELGHSFSSDKDQSTKIHPHTHLRCDYDALCYWDDPAGAERE